MLFLTGPGRRPWRISCLGRAAASGSVSRCSGPIPALRGYFLVGVVLGIAAWHFSLSGIFVEKLTAILRVPIKKILILLKWLKFYARRGRISLYRLVKTVIQKIGNCFGNGEAGGPNGL